MRTINLICICLLFLTCSCKRECPPFDRSLLVWIPYNLGDTIKFYTQSSDTLKFKITEKVLYDDDVSPGRWEKYGCSSRSTIYADEIDGNSNIRQAIYCGEYEFITFNIDISINRKLGVLDLGMPIANIRNHIINEIIINDKIYNNAIIIEGDTIKHPRFSEYWKVILVQNKGIVKLFGRGIPDLFLVE